MPGRDRPAIMAAVRKRRSKTSSRNYAILFGDACRRLAASGVFAGGAVSAEASGVFAFGGLLRRARPGRNDLELLVRGLARRLARAAGRRAGNR